MKQRSSDWNRIMPALAAVLLFAAPDGRADERGAPTVLYVQPIPYLDLWYGGWPCYPGPCMSYQQFKIWERRLERERELGQPPPSPPPMGIEAWHAWPGNALRRVPEADPANAVAQYEESGRVKEEYRDSGEFLPEFLEGRARPR